MAVPMPVLTLRDILMPIFRRRRLMALSFCCVFVSITVFAWTWVARYYVSKMQVLVEQDRSDPAISTAQNAAMATNKVLTTDQVSTEMALLQGQDMLRSVAKTCGLSDRPSAMDVFLPRDPALRSAQKLENAATGLAKSLAVEVEKSSDVINVKYGKVGEPETPACVLQTLGKLYLAKHLQLRRPAGASEFFAQQTQEYKDALSQAEARLVNFSHEMGVAAPDELRSHLSEQVANSEAALVQAREEASADVQRIYAEERQLESTPSRSPAQEVSNSANLLLEQLGSSLLAAQEKRTQLLAKYEPTYPLVREADQEIAQAQAAIEQAEKAKYVNQTTDRDPTYELLRQDLAKTQADLASQKALATATSESIHTMKLQMVDLDQKAVEQAALMREVKADEGNYLLYLNKREQQRSSDVLDAKRIADVAIAVPPVVPSLPAHSPVLVTIIGFVLAVFVSVAAVFTMEYLDGSFRTPAEVAEVLNMPVLASVPRRVA